MKKSIKLLIGAAVAGLILTGCQQTKGKVGPTKYIDTTATSIYGRLSNFSAEADAVKAGDTLTFTVTPAEDFFIGDITNNGEPCTLVTKNENGSAVYSTKIVAGTNKLKASYNVDPGVDFVDKFKLNISDEVFAEVMNPSTTAADKKMNLDFRRSGIEQAHAPMMFKNGKKVANTQGFMNYVDGDTTHVEAKNLGYTIKIRYLGIDTPESTSEIEKWGLTASYYSKYIYTGEETYAKYLDVVPEKAGITSLILVGQQASLHGDTMTLADLKLNSNEQGTYYATADGNQRSLAYVWYATVDHPTKNDFRCLNLEMVYQGFSFGVGSVEDTGEYFYKFFDKANLSAKANKRHLYSDAADANYFDYEKQEVEELSMKMLYTTGTTNDKDIKYLPDSKFCDKMSLYKVKGYVTRKVGTSFYMQDKAEYSASDISSGNVYGMYVFTYSETPIKSGDEVEVIGAISSYGGCYQMQGISYHTLNPDPNRDTRIVSRGHTIKPIEVTGAQFNSIKYPQVLVKITDDCFCYPFTSVYGGETSEIGEGGSQEINKYNEAYPFYNTSNAPIFYAGYGTDNCAEMDANPTQYGASSKSTGLRYSDSVIRFTVDQEILVSYGVDTCFSYKFFTGGSYHYNPKGAEYANLDNTNEYKAETLTFNYKRKKMSNVVVISTGYESTSGKRKMSAKICSGADLTLSEINDN